ncbi:MAG: aminotransferase class I/II-fold pyridoxal phosphate-dependent enzyme, partial [Anaerolineales bacterium]|nr:aminotransferase class I/II-fold pyridoxal phosphate-dependent enzyme [Anaerolineales bacterium]
MFEPQRAVRSDVRTMAPYHPIQPYEILAEELRIKASEIVKLDANENPYGPPSAVQEALAELQDVHIYPDPESRWLRRALARHHGVPFERLMAGAGADELIDLTMRLVIEPGDRIVTCPPTFGMYSF